MAEQFGEKVHEATPYRLEKAREEGNVPRSQDLGSAIILVLATGTLLWLGGTWMENLSPYVQFQLGSANQVTTSTEDVLNQLLKLLWVTLSFSLPIFGILFLAAIVANLMQTGFLFVPSKLKFDISRLDPIKGFGRLVSLQSTARLGFGFFKILIVFAVAAWCIWVDSEKILLLGGLELREIAVFVVSTTLWVSFKIACALLLLAIFDYSFQKWKFAQDMRMTEQEMREEVKQLNGDPQVIRRRREVQRQLMNNRISTAVPQADVTITNPTELAVAIQYKPESMSAPVVVAKGAGTMAQRIRRMSLENNIPIVERKELAQALYRDVEINQEIPVDQYNAVAEVMRYVYELQGKKLPQVPAA